MDNREPLLKKSAGAPTVPLNASAPTNLLTYDCSHFRFVYLKRFLVPAAGTAQATIDIFTAVKDMLVLEVNALVKTAFTTSVTLTIGDGDSAAGFLASADITPQTINTISRSRAAGEAYALGRYYTAGDTIDLVLGGADAAVGELVVEVLYHEIDRYSQQSLA